MSFVITRTPNKSLHPTGVGACSSAFAGDGFGSPVAELFSLGVITFMPGWLLLWIARWSSGERPRKATSADYRLHFGSFFFAGVLMDVGVLFCRPFLDHASAVSIWICATVTLGVLVFGAIAWARLVPAAVSLTLAIITWGAFVWIALRQTHVL